jgi:O-antigen/teichoic acid export membrane protein
VSTVILARLLAPADFGLVAMAMLVVAFVEAWLSFGLATALIQKQNATREHYDTAWTLRILQSAVVAGGIAAAAPLAAAYYHEPRVTAVLWALCPALIVGGFSNIGVVAFRKELEFHKEFGLQIAGKVLGFIITVGAALWLRSYWALVIGIAAGYAVGCALSYAMHPYRPRFSLARFRDLWSYSQWMLVRSIGHFAEMRADEVIVAGLGSTRQMGLYTVAAELGRLPGSEISAPLNQALVPGFAKIQHDAHRLAAAYLNVLGTVSAVTIPAGIGLALVAQEAVMVLLGSQWIGVVPLLVFLAISGAVKTGESLSISLFLGAGWPKVAAACSWLSAALLVGLALPLVGMHGAEGVAMARVGGGVVLIVFIFYSVTRVAAIAPRDIVASLLRPLAASTFMAVAVTSVPEFDGGVLAHLIVKVFVGVVTYCAALLLAWRLVGCPDGAERFFLDQLRARLKR